MRLFSRLFFVGLCLAQRLVSAAALDQACLEPKLHGLVDGVDGRVGICVADGRQVISLNANQRFPLQSVFKLTVAVSVLDAVDQGQLHLDDVITVKKTDLGMGAQPLAKLVGTNGLKITVRNLLFRMLVDNDGTATDVLLAKLGGPSHVQETLSKKGIRGFNIDRTERDLDLEEVGLRWDPKYADRKVFDQAVKALPDSSRERGFYSSERRDTGTPAAVAKLLQSLVDGSLLSRPSSALLLEAMNKTHLFPDRLKAGVPSGWLLAHKTGTSTTWRGITAATNDAGILMAPDSSSFVVAVFIADSHAKDKDRAALIANVARAVVACRK